MRSRPHPLPPKWDCPICLNKPANRVDLAAHNEASSAYGERSYSVAPRVTFGYVASADVSRIGND